jgi:hypothetical protein
MIKIDEYKMSNGSPSQSFGSPRAYSAQAGNDDSGMTKMFTQLWTV